MRPRTFILLILVLLVAAVIALLLFANRSGGIANLLGGGNNGDDGIITPDELAEGGDGDVSVPVSTATPVPQFRDVVISRVRIPVGTMLTSELLTTEQRPITNIALQGGYTFTSTLNLEGQIARVEIARGQEVLAPMLATDPTNVASFGSDIANYIPLGQVAVAFPIDDLSGVALAMRPGDLVDVLMTLQTIEIDPEFRSPLPNDISVVDQTSLLSGEAFLFDAVAQGRLEFVPELNQVALIIPQNTSDSGEGPIYEPIPKRVTQLSIQQAEVLYVGQYQDPQELERQQQLAQERVAAANAANPDQPLPTPTPLPPRLEEEPQVIILSMTLQDALALKWAREEGVTVSLALRSPGDNTFFQTTSVSLPQIIDQGALSIPEPINFELAP